MTARFALFGHPIERSPSPAMHNAAFAALGIDARYELRPTQEAHARSALGEVQDGTWQGANVTTPLKTIIGALVTTEGPASRAKAVNTLWRDGERLVGTLTDVEGIIEPLRRRGGPLGPALLLGAGGAARAAVLALEALGHEVCVAARAVDKARDMLNAVGAKGGVVALGDEHALGEELARAVVVIQATGAGSSLSIPWDLLQRDTIVFDMQYRPRETEFLRAAQGHGGRCIEGWEMLLCQGAASFTRWTGCAAPLDVMRQALFDDLAREVT